MVPQTPAGKLLGGIVGFVGVIFFALPAGIIGSGFSEVPRRALSTWLAKVEFSWRSLLTTAGTLWQVAAQEAEKRAEERKQHWLDTMRGARSRAQSRAAEPTRPTAAAATSSTHEQPHATSPPLLLRAATAALAADRARAEAARAESPEAAGVGGDGLEAVALQQALRALHAQQPALAASILEERLEAMGFAAESRSGCDRL